MMSAYHLRIVELAIKNTMMNVTNIIFAKHQHVSTTPEHFVQPLRDTSIPAESC